LFVVGERTLRLLWTGVFIAGLLALLMKALPPFFSKTSRFWRWFCPWPLH
jgi:hypothetical protein